MKSRSRKNLKKLNFEFESLEARLLMASDLDQDRVLGPSTENTTPTATFVATSKATNSLGSVQSFNQILVKQFGQNLSRRGLATTSATVTLTASAANRGRPLTIQPGLTWQLISQTGANAPTLSASANALTIQFKQAGAYQFRVSSGSVSKTFAIQVASVLAGIAVSPDNVSLAAGSTQPYDARPVDQFGNPVQLGNFAVRWSATGGTIDGNGYFRAGSQHGNYSVTATAISGMTGSRTVQVSVQPRQLSPGSMKQMVDSLYTDQLLNRTEIIQVLRNAGSDNVVTATELADLRYLVTLGSGYRMPDHVRSLATDVLNANPANLRYQGTALGNLEAGSNADHLNKLVDKWFLGTDLPAVTAGSGLSYRWSSGYLINQTPGLADTRQGQLGNCYFLASLSSIANRNPAVISNMFINNGDNTFTVRFFTGDYGYQFSGNGNEYTSGFSNGVGTETYVTVNRMLPATLSGNYQYSNMGTSLTNTSVPIWLALAEKAYAQWNETGRADRDGTNTYNGIESGWMTDVNAQVLGTNSTTHWLSSSTKNDLVEALSSGEAVTIGTTVNTNSNIGWIPNHAYVVSRYDAATDTFDLHNPWGNHHMPGQTWQQLLNNCDAIVVSSQAGAQVQSSPRVRGKIGLAATLVWNGPSSGDCASTQIKHERNSQNHHWLRSIDGTQGEHVVLPAVGKTHASSQASSIDSTVTSWFTDATNSSARTERTSPDFQHSLQTLKEGLGQLDQAFTQWV